MKKCLAVQTGMINIFCLFLSQNTMALFEEYGTYETIDEGSSSGSSPRINPENMDTHKSSEDASTASSSSDQSLELNSTPATNYNEMENKYELFNLCSNKTANKKQIVRIKEALTNNHSLFTSKDLRRNQERTLLHTVIFHQNTKLIKLFIENFLADPQNDRPGFDVEAKDSNAQTPLDYAIARYDKKQ